MTDAAVPEQLRTMRASLQMIDLQLDRTKLPMEGMSDLKSDIDGLRMRLWAIMAARSDKTGPGVLERFRLRRATEMMNQVITELESGVMAMDYPELKQLEERVRRYLTILSRARPG